MDSLGLWLVARIAAGNVSDRLVAHPLYSTRMTLMLLIFTDLLR